MKIVSWNMNHCMRSKEACADAWDYLRHGLKADIALVQEAVPPEGLQSVYRPVGDETKIYNWGSAVVALNPGLTLQPRKRVSLADSYMNVPAADELPDSHPGACIVADVLDSDGNNLLTAVSFYGQWEMIPGGKKMYACTRVHRILSDLTGVLDGARRQPIVLAGDFNLSTQDAVNPQGRIAAENAEAAFARLRAWRMFDCIARTRESRPKLEKCTCTEGDGCAHVQTFRTGHRPDSEPSQLDYAFVSESALPAMSACDVVHDERAWGLSDHCPIVLEIKGGL